MKNTKIFIFSIYLLMTISAHCQTLTNVIVAERKRSESDIQRLSSSFSSTTDFGKFQPPWFTAGLAPAAAPAAGDVDARASSELANWQAAARFARDNSAEFARLMELQSGYGDLVALDPSAPINSPLQVLAYAVLASQDKATLDKYLTDNGFISGSPLTVAVESEIKALKAAIAKVSSPTITVFAAGNIRGVATSDSPQPTTTGTGSLGAIYADSKNIFSAQLSVASTLDTVKSGFGSFVLAPLNGRSLRSGIIEWFPRLNSTGKSWLHLYGTLASSIWELEKDKTYKNCTTLGLGVLYHHRIFEGQIAETDVGLAGEIGLAGRWLDGDVRNLLKNENDKQRYLKIFPTERGFFPGIEFGLSLNFGQVVGALQAYYLLSKKDEPIEGLTRLQLSVGLSVRGDIVRGFLNNKRQP